MLVLPLARARTPVGPAGSARPSPSRPGPRRPARLAPRPAPPRPGLPDPVVALVAPVAALRCAVGAVALLRPSALSRVYGVDPFTARRLAWQTRMLGVREVALGAGSLLAWQRGRPLNEWIGAQALSDLTDALVVGLAARRRRVPALAGAATVVSALLGGLLEAQAYVRLEVAERSAR